MPDRRRDLPSVDRLLALPGVEALSRAHPRSLVVTVIRETLDAVRRGRGAVPEEWEEEIRERLAEREAPSLAPVINATGIILHTNLGRAPLAGPALRAMVEVAGGYSALEFDLSTGARGGRGDHCRALLADLTGAEDALVVNNAAGALLLALHAHAAGRPVAISRGELLEIGGAFRIPEVLERSGALLHEVGTTNRTHLEDYRRALSAGIAAILTVHRSNFEQRGYVTTPDAAELAALARAHTIPWIMDAGSGLLANLDAYGLSGEPRVGDLVGAGADLVVFSGDKLLGGPQAGLLVGRADAVKACRTSPLARALRADKLTLAALEATLALYRDPEDALAAVPVLRMLTVTPDILAERARELAAAIDPVWSPVLEEGSSAAGGGAFPGATLPTTLVTLDGGPLGAQGLALRLRMGVPPVVTRVRDDRVLLDPRTLPEHGTAVIAERLRAVHAEWREEPA